MKWGKTAVLNTAERTKRLRICQMRRSALDLSPRNQRWLQEGGGAEPDSGTQENLRSRSKKFRSHAHGFGCKNDWMEARQVKPMKMKTKGRREGE